MALYEFHGHSWMTKLEALTFFKQKVGPVECPFCHRCNAHFRYLNNLSRRSASTPHHLQPRFQCRQADCRKMFPLQGNIRGPYHKRTCTPASIPPKPNVPLQHAELQQGASYMGNLLLDPAQKESSGMDWLPTVDGSSTGIAPHVNYSAEYTAHCVDDDNNVVQEYIEDDQMASWIDELMGATSTSTSASHSVDDDNNFVQEYTDDDQMDSWIDKLMGATSTSTSASHCVDDDNNVVQECIDDDQMASWIDELMGATSTSTSASHCVDADDNNIVQEYIDDDQMASWIDKLMGATSTYHK